ncbi:anti-sigma factor family protein [Tumebacillus flagellatus]|uniref:anti-sigma factor family protein n=1 Tax=Tumebacillus flagellatus TaxID=1157490 RepID=UPI00068CB83F|nr:zf-HC2 domain-containing protein [Tumebacillus flagellatus]
MNHDHYRDLIQRELDDDLSAEETALLDRHVLACAECRTEREEFRQLALGLSSMKPVVPERSFVGSMEFDFDELLRPQPQVTPLQQKGRRLPARWWQGLSVAAVVVLAIGFTAHYLPGMSSQTAQSGGTNANGQGNPLVALGDSASVKQTGDANGAGQTGAAGAGSSNAGAIGASGSGSSNAGAAGTVGSAGSNAGGAGTSGSAVSNSGAAGASGAASAIAGASGSGSWSAGVAGLQNGAGSSVSTSAGSSSTSGTGAAASSAGSLGSSSASGSSSAGTVSQPESSQPAGSIGSSSSDSKSPDASGPHAGGVVVAGTGDDDHMGLTAGASKPSDSSSHTGLAAASSALQDRGKLYGLVAGALSAESPPLPLIVGSVQQKPAILNEKLQQQVREGDTSARWATVPVQVVQHVLTDIGFAPTAVVTEISGYPDRVNVTQGGQEFLVKLAQPFDTSADGIWQPVQISRTLSRDSQEPTDKPILAYFESLEKNTPVSFSNIEVEESLFMGRTVVGADMTTYTASGVVQKRFAFSFRLRLNGDYSWTLDGMPVIRH